MPEKKIHKFGESNDKIDISELYPSLSSEKLKEAEYYLNRYLELVERIYERTGS